MVSSTGNGRDARKSFDRMLMTRKEVQEHLKLSADAIDRRDSQGKMPRPVPLPGSKRCWIRQEILDWDEASRPSRSDWEDHHQGCFPRDRALQAIRPAGRQDDPVTGPILLSTGELAQLFRVSTRTIHGWANRDRIPPPVSGTGQPRWDFGQLLDWIDHGCPSREHEQAGPDDQAAGPASPDVPATITPCAGSATGAMPFPLAAFPDPLRAFATEAAAAIGCPVDLVALPMLAAAATAIGTSHVIEAKPGWREGARIFAAVVSPPGAGKSPALSAVFDPFRRLEMRFRRKADQGEGADDPEQDRPPARRLIVSDATVEALIPLLQQNPRGMVLLVDELSGWRASFNRYRGGRGNDRQIFLSIFSGDPVTIDRKSSGTLVVPDPLLNVFGTIQPDLLPTLADKGGRADGFLDRILFSFPEPVADRRWSEQAVSDSAAVAWDRVIDRLAAMTMEPDPDGGPDRPRVLRFSPEAKEAWVAWYNIHTAESADPNLGESLRGAWSKLEIYALRLTLIAHLLRVVCDECRGGDVDAESVRRAVLLVGYFKAHARRVHARLTEQPADRRVEQARRWIEAQGGRATARDLQRKNVAGVRKASEARALLAELVDRGLGRIEPRRAGNGQPVDWLVLGGSHP
jgi:predicted DNA-binding transcriptional regulator AlpA